jgi:small GTP-binding protein
MSDADKTAEVFAYDVFLSHSSKDKDVVRDLARRLRDDGLRVWFDEWEIQPGDHIGVKIDHGLESSRILVLVMSANAFASDWATLESHTFRFRDPTNRERRFIPLRLDDVTIPPALSAFAYVNWQQRSDDEYAKLVKACEPTVKQPPWSKEPKKSGTEDVSTESSEDRTQARIILRGHSARVWSVAVTPDGWRIVSGGDDKAVRVWDAESGACLAILEGHTDWVSDVAVTEDGRRIASSSWDKTVRVWNAESGACLPSLKGHEGSLRGVAMTPNGRRIVSAGYDDRTLRVWDAATRACITTIATPAGTVGVAVTTDGRRIVSGSRDNTVRVWDAETGDCLISLMGHTGAVWRVAMSADGRRIVSGSEDNTVRVWDAETGACLARLEGHTSGVFSVAMTPDGRRLVSGAGDTTVRVWDAETGACLADLRGHTDCVLGVAVTADGRRIVSGSQDETVRVWDLSHLSSAVPREAVPTRYTNAKVLLVGDSGVGKSGLAKRLTEDRFEATVSTDAVWATHVRLPHGAGAGDIQREIWLWDFAGQADYRLIHQLFLDETALAVLVFNPQTDDPFEGLGDWDRALQRAARRSFGKLLVAGRVDRGGLIARQESAKRFCEERGFAEYHETSALTGVGCRELREAIVRHIEWKQIPWTASPRIFKLLKDAVLALRDEGVNLLRMSELKQRLELRLPGESSTPEVLRAVVGLLAGPGIVWRLEFGDFVLLRPELINAYAAAVVRSVRAHKEEIGVIPEARVLAGDLDYQDMKRLPLEEEEVVLRAMHQSLIGRGLCVKEPSESGDLLVFPSYFKRERPEQLGHPAVLVTYAFNGPLHEIYATLVVRLHHTPAFGNDRLWRFAADFKTPSGKCAGLELTRKREGAGEIAVYFDPDVPDDTKVTFIRYIHENLMTRARDVVRLRHYICPHCQTSVENRKTALDRLSRGQQDILCVNCEKRVPLWDLIEQMFASDEFKERVRELERQAQESIDNESRELILVGHAFAVAGEAGQIFRPTSNSDWGIDGEIEYKDYEGKASGRRVYLQLKSGDSYLTKQKKTEDEVFEIKNPRHSKYWQDQAYPVMLVIRTSDGEIRWMDVTAYLKKASKGRKTPVRQIAFDGEPFTALNVQRMRDRLVPRPDNVKLTSPLDPDRSDAVSP